MTHVYGPHIFHTANERVWRYVQQFGEWMPYQHRVRAVADGAVFSLPINLLTINQFFGRTMGPEEALTFVAGRSQCFEEPANFEEQALRMIGPELYRAFFEGYTRKQWGLAPTELPASVLKRLPVRFDYEDSYFSHPHQAIPRSGYTEVVASILTVPNIELRLAARFEDLTESFAHVVYTGPIDRYFDFRCGRLGYRTLDFEVFRVKGDYQGAAVMNYCDLDTPYYPIRLSTEETMLDKYVELTRSADGVSFLGRLGSYRYLDMDVTIGEALDAADIMLTHIRQGSRIPSFFSAPDATH